jgi:hypothetical protein
VPLQDVNSQISRLKNIITVESVTINPKHGTEYKVACLVNIGCTANESNFKIDPDDRRFVIFECSSDKKGDQVYFDKLQAALAVCIKSSHCPSDS